MVIYCEVDNSRVETTAVARGFYSILTLDNGALDDVVCLKMSICRALLFVTQLKKTSLHGTRDTIFLPTEARHFFSFLFLKTPATQPTYPRLSHMLIPRHIQKRPPGII